MPLFAMRYSVCVCAAQKSSVVLAPSPYCPVTSCLTLAATSALATCQCAEAIGAIGGADTLPLLESFLDDKAPEVSETCQIAVDRVKWQLVGVQHSIAA